MGVAHAAGATSSTTNGAGASRSDNRAAVKRVLLVALAVNVAMSVLKLVIGLMSGSLAVLADGGLVPPLRMVPGPAGAPPVPTRGAESA